VPVYTTLHVGLSYYIYSTTILINVKKKRVISKSRLVQLNKKDPKKSCIMA
jgi:hypothetical protein